MPYDSIKSSPVQNKISFTPDVDAGAGAEVNVGAGAGKDNRTGIDADADYTFRSDGPSGRTVGPSGQTDVAGLDSGLDLGQEAEPYSLAQSRCSTPSKRSLNASVDSCTNGKSGHAYGADVIVFGSLPCPINGHDGASSGTTRLLKTNKDHLFTSNVLTPERMSMSNANASSALNTNASNMSNHNVSSVSNADAANGSNENIWSVSNENISSTSNENSSKPLNANAPKASYASVLKASLMHEINKSANVSSLLENETEIKAVKPLNVKNA